MLDWIWLARLNPFTWDSSSWWHLAGWGIFFYWGDFRDPVQRGLPCWGIFPGRAARIYARLIHPLSRGWNNHTQMLNFPPVPGGTPAGELGAREICTMVLTVRGLSSEFLPSCSSKKRTSKNFMCSWFIFGSWFSNMSSKGLPRTTELHAQRELSAGQEIWKVESCQKELETVNP